MEWNGMLQVSALINGILLFFEHRGDTQITHIHSPPKETQHLVQEIPRPQFGVNDPIGAKSCEQG